MQERFETFTVLINRISRDIRRIKNQEMAVYHLRSAHVSCLYYIYSLDGVTSAELCASTARRIRRPFPVRWSILKVTDLSSGILNGPNGTEALCA